LSKQELQALNELDLTDNPRLDKVRDLFLVGCWTGLRFSDFSNIQAKNIKGGFITIKTQKTGKEVVIPIHEVVLNILDKYKDKTENSLPPSISNQKMNEYLKEIAEKAEFKETVSKTFTKAGKTVTINKSKFDLVSCHTARRSFATNMYLDSVPSITIMAITGHTTESSFMKYIRITPQEHAEQLQTLWNRDKLKAV
jgi:integrase